MRLFYALPLPVQVRDALAEAAVRVRLSAPGRFIRPDAYHLTLAFVGEVDAQSLPPLEGLLREAATLIPPPSLTLTGLGFFGQRENAILWHGVSGAEPLETVSEALLNGLRRLGLPHDDKPFRPHITLVKQANLALTDLALVQVRPCAWRADAIALFESRRESAGMAYFPLLTQSLGKALKR